MLNIDQFDFFLFRVLCHIRIYIHIILAWTTQPVLEMLYIYFIYYIIKYPITVCLLLWTNPEWQNVPQRLSLLSGFPGVPESPVWLLLCAYAPFKQTLVTLLYFSATWEEKELLTILCKGLADTINNSEMIPSFTMRTLGRIGSLNQPCNETQHPNKVEPPLEHRM